MSSYSGQQSFKNSAQDISQYVGALADYLFTKDSYAIGHWVENCTDPQESEKRSTIAHTC